MTWRRNPLRAAPRLLALDVGSTTVRAILFDLGGRLIAEAACEPAVLHPRPDWAEIDAQERWHCCAQVIRRCLAEAEQSPGQVVAVGLTGLMHALTPLDAAGNALAPAMLWMDQRCRGQAQRMERDHAATIEAIMGRSQVRTTWSAPKLRWISEEAPDLMARTALFLPIQSLIGLRLTGAVATDPSNAGGTFLYDRARKDWSPAMLEIVGVTRDKLPPIVASTAVLGGVLESAAAETGLIAGTPVVIGGSDVNCTRIGANADGNGRACLYLGTAAWIAWQREGGSAFGASATTGAAFRWLVRLVGQTSPNHPGDAYQGLAHQAEKVAPGADGLVFLPHLMGERGPHEDPAAKGVLFGLTLAHGQGALARAVLEGTAYHLRSILEEQVGGPAPSEMVAVGGCAKSALWRGIIADVIGIPLRVPEVLEAGALGAAILAGVGVGLYPNVPSASDALVRWADRREPDSTTRQIYEAIYAVYRDLEERVSPLYARVPVTKEDGG